MLNKWYQFESCTLFSSKMIIPFILHIYPPAKKWIPPCAYLFVQARVIRILHARKLCAKPCVVLLRWCTRDYFCAWINTKHSHTWNYFKGKQKPTHLIVSMVPSITNDLSIVIILLFIIVMVTGSPSMPCSSTIFCNVRTVCMYSLAAIFRLTAVRKKHAHYLFVF